MAIAQGKPTYSPPPNYHDMLYQIYTTIRSQREAYISLLAYFMSAGCSPFISKHYSSLPTLITIGFITLFYHLSGLYLPLLQKIVPNLAKLPSYKTFSENDIHIIIRAYCLGLATLFGWYLSKCPSSAQNFGMYISIISFFHFSEYFFTAISNPKNLGIRSFLLDHSVEYHCANLLACCEYLLCRWVFPSIKASGTGFSFINCLGVLVCLGGETFRKLAMLTCGTNFNHLVEYKDRTDHQLITHGVYSICRHPSYIGWSLWAVGTQLVMGNPLCFFLYIYFTLKFFSERIPDEEHTLMRKFGDKYAQYRENVPIGLPFIKVD